MEIQIFTSFSKKRNSTKKPSGGESVECKLKQPTSWDNPVFQIQSNNLAITNVYVPFNGHYYFVDSITQITNDIIELNCSEDVLATYWDSIKTQTFYIERSALASAQNNMINDSSISGQQDIVYQNSTAYDVGLSAGADCYIVNVVSKDAPLGVQTVALTKAQLTTFTNNLYSTDYQWAEWIGESIMQALFDPFQYVRTVKRFPIGISRFSGTETLSYGWYTSGVVGRSVPESETLGTASLSFHSYYGDFRDYSEEYTRYYVQLPSVGVITIPPEIVARGCTISLNIDYVAGQCAFNVLSGGTFYSSYIANIGADVPLSQVNSAIGSEIPNIIGGTVSAVATGNISGLLTSSARCISSEVRSIGGMSGYVGILGNIFVTVQVVHYGSGEVPSTIGRPSCKNLVLSSLAGYTKCGGASVDLGAFDHEKELVNDYLNNGFYIE